MAKADKSTLQVGISYDRNLLSTLKNLSTTLNDQNRKRLTISMLLKMGYTINDKLSMDLMMPWIRQERRVNDYQNNENYTYSQGIGDLVFLSKYEIVKRLTMGYGFKAPTGSHDQRNQDGLPMFADMQPGSGAWDHIIYMRWNDQLNWRQSLSYYATAIYRLTGQNKVYLIDNAYEFGNELMVMAGIADRLTVGSLIIDPFLIVRYRRAERDKFNDFSFSSSGGSFLFVKSGITWQIKPKISWQLNTELPIYSHVNEIQLAPAFRLNTGLLILIRKDKIFDL